MRSEKLAAIGQLTAGIAHELNNPIAVLQGNLDLLRELLGSDADKVRDELALIDEQAERMRMLMTQLLQFARPTEYAAYVEKVEPAAALDEALRLVAHLLGKLAHRGAARLREPARAGAEPPRAAAGAGQPAGQRGARHARAAAR